ncbi:DUF1553 domain-containing protein [Prosthecobacter sp.]|uniref:DUF1553 domain-containing protein n=1 Tax=Prosthecobacter sp. TaxID=1965333 RepID=UPI002AB870D0|nr:DUF1553 domain-containing protein [Prosthecobacter sp.]MDZ4401830.1 DUF1553 domain-containing protein [Prosthecobacter sp.]
MRTTLFILLAAVPALAVDFDQDIRPLLQERCIECHGEKKHKGELRLDAKSYAFKGGHDGPAIVAGKLDKSPLYQRITNTDDKERMPPKGDPLTPLQITAIKTWIETGAAWPENTTDKAALTDKRLQHWAWQPLTKFDTPQSIDSIIHAKLTENKLQPSPEADRRTLIRRLTFDLHGLPPTPAEVEAFIQDNDPKAYQNLIDRLLASPRYGERYARHWLDIAHYADTHGFERDQRRDNAWRYRDYVINALNADKAYDQFLREQIAGDVLTPNDPQAIAASGFLAAGPYDYVGQVETKSDVLRRSARTLDLDDMVTQVMTAACGVTVNCARCHDHKLDPISQREYYSLWSVFAGLKRGDRDLDTAESARLAAERAKTQKRLREVTTELAKLTGEGLDLADMIGGGNGRGTGTKGAGLHIGNGAVVKDKLGYHRDIKANRLQKPEWGNVNAPKFVQWLFVPDGRDEVNVAAKTPVKGVPPTSAHTWDAIRNGPLASQVSTSIDGTDFAKEGHSILGLHANSAVTFDLAEIRKASGYAKMRLTAMVGFGASKQAANSLADFTVFVGSDQKFQRLKMRKDESARIDLSIPANAPTLTVIATDGGDGGIGNDLLFLGDAKLTLDIESQPLSAADKARVETLRAEEKQLSAKLNAKVTTDRVYAVIADKPPAVQILKRGDPESPADESIPPGTLSLLRDLKPELGTLDTPEGERRNALAAWITDPRNPLTRRVIVNRLWHWHFAQGIVNTPSDFGLGGGQPSHIELLDYLAEELLKSGWSLKHMHKLIVMSQTYRQGSRRGALQAPSAVENRRSLEIDSNNRLLWRQNPRRIEAEATRDFVLAVSGKLNLQQTGGPGFSDFTYTEGYAPVYQHITADTPELWRRSIYRFVVRSTPQKFLTTLDCPDPANLTPARMTTTTALQSLALFNNDFILRQSRYFAERLQKEVGTDLSKQIHQAYALAFSREPTTEEQQLATEFIQANDLFAFCRSLFNANEFVYVD